MSDTREVLVQGQHDRDVGKTFKILEVPPIEVATFILRLLGAIRVGSIDELQRLISPDQTQDADQIEGILRVLAGADAQAVRSLMIDALTYVHVAPDAKHPGMFRALRDDDIKELRTLGDVLGGFYRAHVNN